MNENIPCEVPIQELLIRVPRDLRHVLEDGFSATSIPVGIHCHNAADRISALEHELSAAKEEIARLHEKNCADNEWKDADRAQLTHESDSLRTRLAELRKVAEDLALLVTSLTRHEMQYRPEVKVLSEWKARNPE